MNTWRTLPDGRLCVDFHDGRGEQIPTLDGPNAFTDRIDRDWADLLLDRSLAHGCPLAWSYGCTYAESGGNPAAKSPAGAIGLMQIMPRIHKDATHQDFTDPFQNVDKGCELLGASHRNGLDFPAALATYNAGHVAKSTSSPWGMVTDPGYIDRAIRAANFYLCRALHGAHGAAATGGGAVVLALVLYLAWRVST